MGWGGGASIETKNKKVIFISSTYKIGCFFLAWIDYKPNCFRCWKPPPHLLAITQYTLHGQCPRYSQPLHICFQTHTNFGAIFCARIAPIIKHTHTHTHTHICSFIFHCYPLLGGTEDPLPLLFSSSLHSPCQRFFRVFLLVSGTGSGVRRRRISVR